MNTTDITKENIFQDIDFKELAKTFKAENDLNRPPCQDQIQVSFYSNHYATPSNTFLAL